MTSIIFMGTPDFSVPILSMLRSEGYDVIAVVTQPDRPVGRKRVLTPPPVKVEAEKLGIRVIQPEKLTGSAELDEIISLNADLIITAAFGQLLPNELLDAPKLGCINVHASLLPKYRGGAPIHKAIMDGEMETGVTIMYMVEKLDAGDIISQVSVPINDTDDTGTLFDVLSEAGVDLLKNTLPSILNETNERIVQDESLVTFARNISREEERIDWTKGGKEIYDKIRGLHPWPVAYSVFQDANVKIWWSEKVETSSDAEPGTIIDIETDRIIVKTGDNTGVAITDIQPAGRKRMPAEVFIRGIGAAWNKGDRFE
ncbi:methionyl-tRNA formyltransferase [Sporosarcina sp. Marseille-Q4063]|uniref:methionyl-tRNA formyltransferase n=1 Tax=Sporosarcina sp. Marseille-Q4063 TaxID=2810514 RepID=UPI001BAFF503|nr:methionyl-tRNA formyltransferase [Sporosarcina sp. Marseille-Q4063]QUW21830.1 methionyl-tRNA formyltransferase [Sporosarcina sp. Marseille-Q4063]